MRGRSLGVGDLLFRIGGRRLELMLLGRWVLWVRLGWMGRGVRRLGLALL